MQADLAMRTSNYSMQVQQQLFKRMNPAQVVPESAEELVQKDVSMTAWNVTVGFGATEKQV